jgi:hypothetical protein
MVSVDRRNGSRRLPREFTAGKGTMSEIVDSTSMKTYRKSPEFDNFFCSQNFEKIPKIILQNLLHIIIIVAFYSPQSFQILSFQVKVFIAMTEPKNL